MAKQRHVKSGEMSFEIPKLPSRDERSIALDRMASVGRQLSQIMMRGRSKIIALAAAEEGARFAARDAYKLGYEQALVDVDRQMGNENAEDPHYQQQTRLGPTRTVISINTAAWVSGGEA